MTDRQQIRREAEQTVNSLNTEGAAWAEIVLALLDELEQDEETKEAAVSALAQGQIHLEQAEANLNLANAVADVAERDARRWEEMYDAEHRRLREAESRLEKVDSVLVEALKIIADEKRRTYFLPNRTTEDLRKYQIDHLETIASKALAAWEDE
jgi:hypothetical protein